MCGVPVPFIYKSHGGMFGSSECINFLKRNMSSFYHNLVITRIILNKCTFIIFWTNNPRLPIYLQLCLVKRVSWRNCTYQAKQKNQRTASTTFHVNVGNDTQERHEDPYKQEKMIISGTQQMGKQINPKQRNTQGNRNTDSSGTKHA